MTTYSTIHTTAGLSAMAQAEATGTPVNLTHMAVGDGNGNPVTPSEGQTTLAREMYRATVNRVFQDPVQTNRFTAELVIPNTVGSFVLREVGVFDSHGTLFVVGNLPDTYKPVISEGAYADTVVRVEFLVTNASVVTLQIDPNVAVATQTWISNAVTAASILPGGTTHQIARKRSNADGDIEWADPTDANVVVNTIEEKQTLAGSQTAVVLTTTTTNGLTLYIEGVRLRAELWTTVDATHLTLASSYPAGTILTAVQNEPAGSVVSPLSADLNLSDLPNKATARANLDVYSKAEADQKAPPGAVVHFARSTAPTGWLKANGAAVSRTAYADLFAAIGTTYGAGDGFNTFNLPDLRGEFVRGWDDGRGIDTGRAMGSAQAAYLPSIPRDGWGTAGIGLGAAASGRLIVGSGAAEYGEFLESLREAGGDHTMSAGDTRPRNVALLACIRY